jgi:hypothetical protein
VVAVEEAEAAGWTAEARTEEARNSLRSRGLPQGAARSLLRRATAPCS